MELLLILLLWFIFKVLPDIQYSNYHPPQGYKIDYGKANIDAAKNNLSKEQIMRNTVNGKYNVKR